MATYPELQVFPIGEIKELAVLLVLDPGHDLVPSLVLISVIRHQNSRHTASKSRSHDDGDLGGDIFWRILAPESQWPNDVSEACILIRVSSSYSIPRLLGS